MRAIAGVTMLCVALLVGSCTTSDDRATVLVMAAASLTDGFAEIEVAFEASNPGTDVQLNLAGSGSLREQILQGAPGDVFASANEATMQQVIDAGAAQSHRTFATNSLAIAVPLGNPAGITSIDDLAKPDLLIGLCAPGVPCGDLARQALAAAGVTASIDTNEGDVRALLTKIEAGELDAGIVYTTDIASSAEVESVALPDGIDLAVDYPIAVLSAAPNTDGAVAFVDFVLSDQGQALLGAAGFGAP